MYQRAALIFDAEGGSLSVLSLTLIESGISPHYSADMDELVLLSREYASRIGAIVVPAERIERCLSALLARVVAPLGLSTSTVVPVGSEPSCEVRRALAKQGVRWALWRPFDAPDLRFVVAQVLSSSDPEELRLHGRVPCQVPAQLESPLRQAATVLTDLSPGGCFARLAEPLPRGARVRVRCELAGERVAIGARVAWATGPDTPEWHERGIGIEFLEMPDEARAQLARCVDERIDRYLL